MVYLFKLQLPELDQYPQYCHMDYSAMYQELYTVPSWNSICGTFDQYTYFIISSRYPPYDISTALASKVLACQEKIFPENLNCAA